MFGFVNSVYSVKLLPLLVVLSFGITISLYVAIIISYRDFDKAYDEGFYKDNFLTSLHTRIIVHNGLNIYAAWATVAQSVLLSASLTYFNKVTMDSSCIIGFSLLIAITCIYVFLDIFLWDKYTRYVVTPHIVLVWSFSSILSKNYNPGDIVSIMTVVMLALTIVALIGKIVLMTIRDRKAERNEYTEIPKARRIL